MLKSFDTVPSVSETCLPMDKSVVEKINEGPYKIYFALAGAGAGFLSKYIAFGGASKVLIGANIPYNQRAFDKFIRGSKVDSYASLQGARKLALNSYLTCLEAGVPKEEALGVGASCSVASTSEREGRKHKIHIAFHSLNFTRTIDVILNQGRTRAQEEEFVECQIYSELAMITAGLLAVDKPSNFKMRQGETGNYQNAHPSIPEIDLISGGSTEIIHRHPVICDDTLVIYPGSWNPLHIGHETIERESENILSRPVVYEFTVSNAEKGVIDYIELQNRRDQLENKNYIITRAPTIHDKVAVLKRAFPDKNLIFVVGYDTWKRVWEAKYCIGGDVHNEWNFFYKNKVKFLVFGRGDLFQPLPGNMGEEFRIKSLRAESFRMDISSSELRKSNL
jgi:nicotinic acid mononucleotide adenylyltransferase